MDKWNRLQTLAHERDERLKENRRKWKQFKRQLEDLELAANHFTNTDNLCKLIHMFFIMIYVGGVFSASNSLFKSGCTS